MRLYSKDPTVKCYGCGGYTARSVAVVRKASIGTGTGAQSVIRERPFCWACANADSFLVTRERPRAGRA